MNTQVFTEAKGILTPTPAANGIGTQDGGFPDGTQARRLQVAARLTRAFKKASSEESVGH